MTGEEIVAEARRWVGTPFRHQGRLRSVGVDCAGLVLGVGKALGLLPEELEYRGYSPGVQDERLLPALAEWLLPGDRAPGSIALMRFEGVPKHLGFITDVGLLHIRWGTTVGEHPIDARWERRLERFYVYRRDA